MWRRVLIVIVLWLSISSGLVSLELAYLSDKKAQDHQIYRSAFDVAKTSKPTNFPVNFFGSIINWFDHALDWTEAHHDFVIAVATVFLAIFTLALFAATWGLLRFARIQSRDAQRSLRILRLATLAGVRQSRATVKLAETGDRHADLAESSLHDLQRAYIHLHSMQPMQIAEILSNSRAGAYPIYPVVRISLKNFGKTPGNIRSAGILVDISDEIPPIATEQNLPHYQTVQEAEVIEVIIGENEVYPPMGATEPWDLRSTTSYTVDNIQQINKGISSIYCHGWIEYLDIFMKVHETVFCRKYIVRDRRFVPVGGLERNHGN
jgi:hypothetical protein